MPLASRRGAAAVAVVGGVVVFLLVVALAWSFRHVLARFFPVEHEGEVMRIAQFHKGGFDKTREETRQINQFAIIFADGFQCEGTDTSFAAVREGDRIRIRGYHDVKGAPVMDPEWWECDEAQLIELVEQRR